jgi:amino acid permease
MAYAYSSFVITVICFVCYRLIKKKSAPSNRYTHYDDITMGIKDDDINAIQDTTNHHIQNEEKSNNDKTI